ncbi:NAD(P)-dependent oxidoreductase [Mariniluteicoccus flavus]
MGLVGLGAMGAPMAARLLDGAVSGSVWVTSRRRESATGLVDAGARWADTPRELARHCDVAVVMVQDTAQIRAVLGGPDGLAAGADHPIVLVVASSISPTDVAALRDEAAALSDGNITVVDAPVSGGVEGARAGTLSIMVGGAEADVAVALPLLRRMGTPVHLGPLGAGQVAKACNQLIVAATTVALAEASLLAENNGLDVGAMFALLQGGYAGSRLMEVKSPQLAAHDHAPRGPARFMIKDLAVAAEAADGLHLAQLPLLQQVFADLVARGLGDQDVTVVQEFLSSRESPGRRSRP